MKLAVIYNVFDGEELLEGSIKQIRQSVDLVICVTQTESVYKDKYEGGHNLCKELKKKGLVDKVVHVTPEGSAYQNELYKRNLGLNIAKNNDCTHFITMDCDEYYFPGQFKIAKEIAEKYDATAIKWRPYFKDPQYTFDMPLNDYVSFITKLRPDSKFGYHKYPYWVDPTRSTNDKEVHLIPEELCYMHHFTWIRKSIERKFMNSTARKNILKSKLFTDYKCAKPGYYVDHWKKKIILVENYFNIDVKEELQ